MKTLTLSLLLALTCTIGFAQKTKPDSLKQALKIATTDSDRNNIYVELLSYYSDVNKDSALFYADKCLALAKQNNDKLAEASYLTKKGRQYAHMGSYAASYQSLLLALRIAEDPNNEEKNGWLMESFSNKEKERLSILANVHSSFNSLMSNTGNQKQQIFHNKEALKIARQINDLDVQMISNNNLAGAYLNMNQLDSAFYFAKEAFLFSKNPTYRGSLRSSNIGNIGDIYLKKGDKQKAKKYYYEGLSLAIKENNQSSIARINHSLIQVFLQENEKDSALVYAVKNLGIVKSVGSETEAINTGLAFEDIYLAYQLKNQLDSAYKYQGLALLAKDSFYKTRIKNIADFQNLSLEETKRLENLEKEKIETQSKIRTYTLLSVLAVLSIIGFLLYRNNRQKQKANKVLLEQKVKVESTLSQLKSTQAQLIQSEKLASLGELTAGIAHEIQNPLNFVNNFSEVSAELVQEIKEERQKPKENQDESLVDEIFNDISQNLEKITLHGKRASSIVKGMLEHSRQSSGERELTDINILADEYLRLSYHGIRAKDNNFNSDYQTDFDENLPKIEVISQDMGRVLLNLINNAFWAVNERNKKGETGYAPKVTVTTQLTANSQLLIAIKDNGTGMSETTKAKIFQPFFTTKPTGQGTGLGLSLAYDIVAKGHGGTIEVETKEGEGSTFILKLPIQNT